MPQDWKQTLVGAVVLGLVCAYVVWMLERFQTEKMIEQFKEQCLDKLPTFRPEGAQ